MTARFRSMAARVGLLLGLLAGLAPLALPPAVAAAPSLTVAGAATYDVLPDEGRVAVTVQLTATNHLKNTATKRYVFRTTTLTVLPGTSDFRLSGGAGKPKVAVTRKTDTYTNLKLTFGADLAAGKSTTLTLTFDIKDPGGAPDRPVRISPSLTSFAAWAYASPDTPGATVDVRFPAGYNVTVGRGPLEGPASDGTGHETWSSGPIAAPLEFVADISADRPSDYAETSVDVALANGPATVLLRAWPDDQAWRDRIQDLVQRALPVLEREIGVPWPVDGPLAIHEVLVRSTGGYAGLFDPAERKIEIAYAATDGVVLHELAHAWFNGRLVADRWAAEGFASYYAELAAAELGVEPDRPGPPPDPGRERLPLNDWGPSGSGTNADEVSGYATSLELAEAIAERAGADGLRTVWLRAAAGDGAYRPISAPGGVPAPITGAGAEAAGGPPDWRGLLDLLEDPALLAHSDQPAGASEGSYVDLWRRYVTRPADEAALDAREAARTAYVASVVAAGEWQLPLTIRGTLRAWQFETAQELLAQADAVTAQWTALETAAAASGLQLPDRVRQAFEGPAGLDAAAAEARAEQATVDAIARARASEPGASGLVDQAVLRIGLLGATPRADLDAAAQALASGDVEDAYGAALRAEAAWTAAPGVGRSRIVSAVLLLVALLMLTGMILQRRRAGAASASGGAGAT